MKSDSWTRPRSASEATLTIAMRVSSLSTKMPTAPQFIGRWRRSSSSRECGRIDWPLSLTTTRPRQVHLGVVHVVALRHAAVRAREKAIRELRFLAPQELGNSETNSNHGRKLCWTPGKRCSVPTMNGRSTSALWRQEPWPRLLAHAAHRLGDFRHRCLIAKRISLFELSDVCARPGAERGYFVVTDGDGQPFLSGA